MAQRGQQGERGRQHGLGLVILVSVAACSKTDEQTGSKAEVGFATGDAGSLPVPGDPSLSGDAGSNGSTPSTSTVGTSTSPGGSFTSDSNTPSGGFAGSASSGSGESSAGGTSASKGAAGGSGGDGNSTGGTGGSEAAGTGGAGTGGAGTGGAGGAPPAPEECLTFPETEQLKELVVCQERLVCPVGEARRVDVDAEARTFTQSCVPCSAGYYKEQVSADYCFPCRVCGTLGVALECSAASNTRCEHSGVMAQFGSDQLNMFFGGIGAGESGAWLAGFLAQPQGGDNAGAYVGHVGSDGAIELVEEYPVSGGDERLRAVAVPNDGTVWVGGIRGNFGYTGVIRRFRGDNTELESELLSAGEQDQVQVQHLVVDGQGSVWAAGITNGLLQGAHLGSYDIFLAKYSGYDAQPKVVQFGSPGTDYIEGFAVDASGTPWIAGHISTSIPDDPQSMFEPFLGRVETDEELSSVSLVPLTSLDSNIYLMGLALDGNGAPVIIARDRSNEPLSDEGVYLVRKYDTQGNIVFSDYIGTPGLDWVTSVLVDDQGRIWVGGSSACNLGDTDLPGITAAASSECYPRQASMGGSDAFVRIYAADGSASETHQLGSAQYDTFGGMASHDGTVWVAGITKGAIGSVRAPGYNQTFVWQLEL